MHAWTQRTRTLRGAALALLAGAVCAARGSDLPFMDSFDNHGATVLHTQNEWEALRNPDVQLQGTVVFAGAKAAFVATNTVLVNRFGEAAATNVWIDFYARQSWPTNAAPPVITGSVAAAFCLATNGYIRALSNSTWVTLNYQVPSNTWHRYTVNIDYASSNWGLYIADQVPNRLSTALATNLAFGAASTNSHFQVFRVKN